MLHLIQKHTIMNKFERFLDRISAETCLKMDYLVVNLQKSPSARRLRPPDPLASGGFRPPFRLND